MAYPVSLAELYPLRDVCWTVNCCSGIPTNRVPGSTSQGCLHLFRPAHQERISEPLVWRLEQCPISVSCFSICRCTLSPGDTVTITMSMLD